MLTKKYAPTRKKSFHCRVEGLFRESFVAGRANETVSLLNYREALGVHFALALVAAQVDARCQLVGTQGT